MTILGIETSCDETSAAVVRGRRVLSNVVSSQINLHAPYQGVVPELASRAHMERLSGVVESALRQAFGRRAELSRLKKYVRAVAFTRGPGLAGALLMGKVAAQTLAEVHGLPLIGVNHLEAHALAMGLVRRIRAPFLSLIVSGGHTDLMLVRRIGSYRILGRTRDDAAGEVFDKVAKFLRLGYPGGPAIDRIARKGKRDAVAFARPLMPGTWDFSFSGIKTAVLYYVRDAGFAGPATGQVKRAVRPAVPVDARLPKRFTADLTASFQEAVVETLVDKSIAAARSCGVRRIVAGGGVAVNSRLRSMFAERARAAGVRVFFPPLVLCTDNAAMVAHVAALRLRAGRLPRRHGVNPSMPIRSWA